MYRVFRYSEVPSYWPAVATVYVDYPNGSVEEYVTDKEGTPKLVGSSGISKPIKDGLNAAASPSTSNPFATMADVNAVSFPYPGAGIPLSTGSGWGTSLANNSADWNTAFSWGDHALAGYGTSNFNPTNLLTDYGFTDNSTDWNTAYGWGDHAGLYANSAQGDKADTAYSWGDHSLAGYLTSFSETDPIFSASASAGIAGTDITNWNTAHSWGNHASAGYALSSSLSGYVPYTGATADLNTGTYSVSASAFTASNGGVFVNRNGDDPYFIFVRDNGAYIAQLRGITGGGLRFTLSNPTTQEVFRYSNSGNVSIGTTSDLARLAVKGASSVTGNAILAQNSNSTDLFAVLNNGNVGIGIATPSQLLHLSSATNTQILLERTGGSAASFAISVGNSRLSIGSGFWLLGNAVGINQQTPTASLHAVGSSATTGSVALFQNSTPSELFRILNNGNIGVGYATPTAKLSIGNDSGYNGVFCVGNVGAISGRIALIGNLEIVSNGNTSWSGQGISIAGAVRTFELIAAYSITLDDSLFSMRVGSHAGAFGNPTSGEKYFLRIGMASALNKTTFAPTSGNAIYNIVNITSDINQTGGANGITRGIYIAPTLTAAADYRAIEAITGNSSAHTLMKLNNGVQDVFCVKGDGKAGFFGVAPASQQTMGVATAGATYTAAEQAMIQKCWDVLRSFGLGN